MTLIIDLGYWKEDPRLPPSAPRTQIVRCDVDPDDSIHTILWDLSREMDILGFQEHESAVRTDISVLRRDLDADSYELADRDAVQHIFFAYGPYGELEMLPLPQTIPTKITINQLRRVVDDHFPNFDSSTIIIRYRGGFGGAGTSLMEELTGWLLSESASFVFSALVGWLLANLRKLAGTRRNITRTQRYAQFSRDLISRHITSALTLRNWLDTKPIWRLSDVMEALVLPRRLAKHLLKDAGYMPSRNGKEWSIGQDKKARERRELWLARERQGYGWSPLKETR
ncbi:hypothetical protein MUN78_11490 [Leucobacter allii]|uniref:Uncharacterized protein n=1 Tax=Leucobacter allii TaxID=2932247 RepID=A0ABY4FKJ8_9MICO|nr:hypothetical protein [Leucobacter allii]UOQ56306.1 hypothetical protein MUN78_11490 [Leucobacter allii]